MTNYGWIGEDCPQHMTEIREAAFEHYSDYSKPEDDIREVIVCNDDAMAEEQERVIQNGLERSVSDYTYDLYRNTSKEELKDILNKDYQILHYIGHTNENGIKCSDGLLRTDEITNCNIPVFLLNSCSSRNVGRRLIDVGSVCGITTSVDIPNEAALEMGGRFSKLLDSGINMQSAYQLSSKNTSYGFSYELIGETTFKPVQKDNANWNHLMSFNPNDDGTFDVSAIVAPADKGLLGAISWFFLGKYYDVGFISPREITLEAVSQEDVEEFLDKTRGIGYIGDELHVHPEGLRETLNQEYGLNAEVNK
jgi:hypothetical protein